MPLYTYLCSAGHEFEAYAFIRDETLPCRTCGETAQRQFSFGRGRSNAQPFKPILIHVNDEGKPFFPGRDNEPPPEGYHPVEIRTLQEAEKFERGENKRLCEEWEREQAPRLEAQEQADHDRREDLRSRVRTEFGKNFMRVAVEKANEAKRKKFDPRFHFKIFSDDASNRRPWNDVDTEFRDRRY